IVESTETTMIFTTGRHEYSITKRALKGYIFTELSTNSGTQSSRIFDTPEALINFIIVQVAEKIGYSSGKITSMFSDDMSNFRKYENELRIRICDEINCKNVFDEGFLTEDSNVFCSEKC